MATYLISYADRTGTRRRPFRALGESAADAVMSLQGAAGYRGQVGAMYGRNGVLHERRRADNELESMTDGREWATITQID